MLLDVTGIKFKQDGQRDLYCDWLQIIFYPKICNDNFNLFSALEMETVKQTLELQENLVRIKNSQQS